MSIVWVIDKNNKPKQFLATPFHGFLLFDNQYYSNELADTDHRYTLYSPDGLVAIDPFKSFNEIENTIMNYEMIVPPLPVQVSCPFYNRYNGQIGKCVCHHKLDDRYLIALENKTHFIPIGWYVPSSFVQI